MTLTSCVVTRILTGRVKVLMTSGLHTSSRMRRLSDRWRDRNNLHTVGTMDQYCDRAVASNKFSNDKAYFLSTS